MNRNLFDVIGERLSVAAPDCQVVLFGSHARGDSDGSSDIDLLVIAPEVVDLSSERKRLRRSLRDLHVPIDLVVIDRETADRWAAQPGSLVHRALDEGVDLVA